MNSYHEKRKEELKLKFVTAGKQIIEKDGIASFSARKLAEIAGYSYTSIYNYYKSLDEYLWHVSISFIDDIEERLKMLNPKPALCFEEFIKGIESYCVFFFEKPNIFEFLFFYHMDRPTCELKEKLDETNLWDFLTNRLSELYSGKISEKYFDNLANIIVSLVHGKLLFYFSGKTDTDKDKMTDEIRENLKFILSNGELSCLSNQTTGE